MNTTTTIWVKGQQWWSLFWIAIDLVIATTFYFIFSLVFRKLIEFMFSFIDEIGKNSYIMGNPLAFFCAILVFAAMLLLGWYNIGELEKGFRVNRFFWKNRFKGFHQGVGIGNFLERHVDNVPWDSQTEDVDEVKFVGKINGQEDEYRFWYTRTWRPKTAMFLFRGKDNDERLAAGKKNSRAVCDTYIQNCLRRNINPQMTKVFANLDDYPSREESYGIEVTMTVKSFKPSQSVINSINDRREAEGQANGIETIKNRLGIDSKDAAAIRAGKYEKKVTENVFTGDPELIAHLRLQHETGEGD